MDSVTIKSIGEKRKYLPNETHNYDEIKNKILNPDKQLNVVHQIDIVDEITFDTNIFFDTHHSICDDLIYENKMIINKYILLLKHIGQEFKLDASCETMSCEKITIHFFEYLISQLFDSHLFDNSFVSVINLYLRNCFHKNNCKNKTNHINFTKIIENKIDSFLIPAIKHDKIYILFPYCTLEKKMHVFKNLLNSHDRYYDKKELNSVLLNAQCIMSQDHIKKTTNKSKMNCLKHDYCFLCKKNHCFCQGSHCLCTSNQCLTTDDMNLSNDDKDLIVQNTNNYYLFTNVRGNLFEIELKMSQIIMCDFPKNLASADPVMMFPGVTLSGDMCFQQKQCDTKKLYEYIIDLFDNNYKNYDVRAIFIIIKMMFEYSKNTREYIFSSRLINLFDIYKLKHVNKFIIYDLIEPSYILNICRKHKNIPSKIIEYLERKNEDNEPK